MGVRVYCDICGKGSFTMRELPIAEVLIDSKWLCWSCYNKVVDIIKACTRANTKEPQI